jgi:hypothetical protein
MASKKFQHKHDTEAAARAQARSDYSGQVVTIIESRGVFYLEDGECGFIRSFEREVYSGLGKAA